MQERASKTRPGAPLPSPTDVIRINDQQQNALNELAVKITLSAARPGTGDAILIFVAGMGDIESVVETFLRCAPSQCIPPSTHLQGEEEEEEEKVEKEGEGKGEGKKGGVKKKKLASSRLNQSKRSEAPFLKLIPMHSLIAEADQMQAFDASDTSTTRVCIATNIAESSLTIPGVTTVIDSGRHKAIEYDSRLEQSVLKHSWVRCCAAFFSSVASVCFPAQMPQHTHPCTLTPRR